MTDTADSPPTETVARRSRRRRNVVGGSPHREEYERLILAGWNSMALERYALARYGEEIPASTFRSYKKRKGLKSEVQRFGEIVDPERMVDVMGLRSEIIQLQVERIKIDAQHERDMRKLFGTTRGEIGLLNQLLSEHKLDLQDLGLFPKAGEALMITHGTPEADEVNAPKHVSLAAALGVDADGEAELAQVLHMQLKNAESG